MPVIELQTNHARTNQLIYPYNANSVQMVKGVLTIPTATSPGSIFDFGLIPPDAILCFFASGISNEDLAASTSPVLDVGLYGENGSLSDLGYSDDPNCLRTALSLSTANATARLNINLVDGNRPVWHLIDGVSLNKPVRGPLRVKASTRTADTDQAGNILIELCYFVR